MAIQVDLTDIVMAGSEMIFYHSAIKDAERFDTARIDAFEKRTDLFNKLKAKCEAQGYTVKQVKWFYGVQQYVDVMLNLQKNKQKALCKRFPVECSKAKAAFDEFIRAYCTCYKNFQRRNIHFFAAFFKFLCAVFGIIHCHIKVRIKNQYRLKCR